MLRSLLLPCALLFTGLVFAQAPADSLAAQPLVPVRGWVYFDLGIGEFAGEDAGSFTGGVCLGWANHLVLNAYYTKQRDFEATILGYIPSRYIFTGPGLQLGYTYINGRFALIPGIGVCTGQIILRDDLKPCSDEFFPDYYWAEEQTEQFTYIPFSLTGQVSASRVLGGRLKLEYLYHRKYPILNLNMGICLGSF